MLRAIAYCLGLALGAIEGVVLSALAIGPMKTGDAFYTSKNTLTRTALLPASFSLAAGKWSPGPLLYGLAQLWGVLVSSNRHVSIHGYYCRQFSLAKRLTDLGLSLAAMALSDSGKERVRGKMILCGFLVAGYAILQRLGKDPLEWHDKDGRPRSTIGNANTLGNFLAINIPLTAGRLADAQHWEQKLFYGLTLGIMGCGLLASGTRGAMMGAATGSAYLFASNPRKHLIWGIPAMVIGIVAGMKSWHSLKAGLTQRLLVWRDGLKMIARRPWGYGNENIAVPFSQQRSKETAEGEFAKFDRLHNVYLDELFMRGIPGLFSYLYANWQAIKGRPTPGKAAIIANLASNCFSFDSPSSATYHWLHIGMESPSRPMTRGQKIIAGLVTLLLAVPNAWQAWKNQRAELWWAKAEATTLSLQSLLVYNDEYKLGWTLMARKKTDQAISEYMRAIRLNPKEQGYAIGKDKGQGGLADFLYQISTVDTERATEHRQIARNLIENYLPKAFDPDKLCAMLIELDRLDYIADANLQHLRDMKEHVEMGLGYDPHNPLFQEALDQLKAL